MHTASNLASCRNLKYAILLIPFLVVGVRSCTGPLTNKPTMSNNDDGSRRFKILVMLALGTTAVGRLEVNTATHVVPFMSTTNLWGRDMNAGFARVSKTTLDFSKKCWL